MEKKPQIKKWREYKKTNIDYRPYRSRKPDSNDYFDTVYIKDKNLNIKKRPKLNGVKNDVEKAWRKSLPIVKDYHENLEKISVEKKNKRTKVLTVGKILDDYETRLCERLDEDLEKHKTTERKHKKNKASLQSCIMVTSKYFGHRTVKKITIEDIQEYIQFRRIHCFKDGIFQRGKTADSTIGQELVKIETASQDLLNQWSIDLEKLRKNKEDYFLLKYLKALVKYARDYYKLECDFEGEPITYQQFVCAIEHITDNKRIESIYDDLFTYAFWTGGRKGEMLELTWSMIDLKEGIVTLPEALLKESNKNKKKYKKFKVVKEVQNMLIRLKENNVDKSDYVFVKKNGKSVETLYDRVWRKIRKACNFTYSYDNTKYMKAHSFRNSYVVNSGKAENGKAGSRTATGHSQSMELYYNDNWEVHCMFVEKLEDWKQHQEEKFGKPLNELIKYFYWELGLNQEQISKKIERDKIDVIRLMNKFDIPKRPKYQYISSLKGKNHSMFGKTWEEIQGRDKAKLRKKVSSERFRELTIRRLENNEFPCFDTKIEKIMAKELLKREISFVKQFNVKNKFVCDIAIPYLKIIIECDGDYWHANPKIYDKHKLTFSQKKNIQRDKIKDKYLQKEGWTVLRFFESDIKSHTSSCLKRVEKKIESPIDNLDEN